MRSSVGAAAVGAVPLLPWPSRAAGRAAAAGCRRPQLAAAAARARAEAGSFQHPAVAAAAQRRHGQPTAGSRRRLEAAAAEGDESGPLDDAVIKAVADPDAPESVAVAATTAALVGQEPGSAVQAAVAAAQATLQREPLAEGAELEAPPAVISAALAAIYSQCQTWHWRSHAINYVTVGQGPPVLLVHGFGASIGHWRKNIPVLAEEHTVYALDLLGLGASAKPTGFKYTMETWGELLVDFIREIVLEPVVLVGNSIGSLATLIAGADAPQGLVRGVVLLNCAGGMNNKAVVDDWRLRVSLPIFWLIDWILLQPDFARRLFDRVKSKGNIRNVLQSVYSNKDAVDDELIEVILKPANDEGALDAFVSIITGPPGPRPEALVPRLSSPLLIVWGDEDPFTPNNGPVGRYFRKLQETRPDCQYVEIKGMGHCPHDDDPQSVHDVLLPWLAQLPKPLGAFVA